MGSSRHAGCWAGSTPWTDYRWENAFIYIFLHIVPFNLNSDHKAPLGWTIRPKYDPSKNFHGSLQVPQAALETWLVQREQEPLPGGFADQTSPLMRAPAGVERDLIVPADEPRTTFGVLQEEEREEEEAKEVCLVSSLVI